MPGKAFCRACVIIAFPTRSYRVNFDRYSRNVTTQSRFRNIRVTKAPYKKEDGVVKTDLEGRARQSRTRRFWQTYTDSLRAGQSSGRDRMKGSNVMYGSWKMKRSHRRRVHNAKRRHFRWEVLGLPKPVETSITTPIEDVRRQIITASSYGLSPETVARARTKGASRQSVPKEMVSHRTRGARS